MVEEIIHHFLCVWSGWATSAPFQPQQHLDCCCVGINNLPSVVCLDPSFVSRSYCDLSTDSFLFYFKSFPAFSADKVRFSLCCTNHYWRHFLVCVYQSVRMCACVALALPQSYCLATRCCTSRLKLVEKSTYYLLINLSIKLCLNTKYLQSFLFNVLKIHLQCNDWWPWSNG